VLFISGFM